MSNELVIRSGGDIAQRRGDYIISSQGVEVQLKRDVHFGKPNAKLKQPVLYKGGAEAIRIQYGVFDRYEIQHAIEDFEHGFFFYRIKCSLVKLNPADGKEYVITEGYGSANSRESSGGNASGFDLANQRLKIAEKRAMVDAVIKMAGLSTIFTQDMENDDFMAQSAQITSAKPEDAITPKQRQRIFAIAASKGMNTEQCRVWLKAQGFASTKDIKQSDYDKLCELLDKEGT